MLHSKTLYHGSITRDIEKFNPGSHFGTREQALYAILASGIRDNKSLAPVTGYIYECKFNYSSEGQIHETLEWGTPRHSGALMKYLDGLGRVSERQALWREHGLNMDATKPIAYEILKNEMDANRHKALSYINKIEGEGLSYMIINPSDISITKITKPSSEELIELLSEKYKSLFLNSTQDALAKYKKAFKNQDTA